MRMYKKREILQGISILKRASRKLRLIPCGTGNEVLQQCQELAITIGNKIEEYDTNSLATVNYIEEYCEALYKAFTCENKKEYKAIIKEHEILLQKIEKSVKEDIENSPYEVVFMPYKASMWDAFDSVYRAAQNDKNCHIVVMPVPYYNLNRNEQQVEIHYEGAQFPEDIPITDFQNYFMEEMHPDIIFIHNPYDQCNYVTQLPEQYFSSNLVKYTDYLVYIPYFITLGDKIKEEYCVMPAVKNAWRTFVQSEAVRKYYIKYGADPKQIVTMGSPKFDMVIRMEDNQLEIPEEWRDIFKNRKTFLLNTHLNPIINEAEKVIEKLHRIFILFENRDDIALLWRPHPLSIETAKAMNPQILNKYLGIVEEFKSLPNGVYDDTPDVHRAIAISDAYIGDWSSIVTLYGITGKPMYILNIKIDINISESEIEKRKRERGFSFSCAAELDGYLWAPGDLVNGLFQICEKTGECKFVTSFYREKSDAYLLYTKVVPYGRKLFFIPYRAGHIAEYNVDTGKMKYYDIYNNQEIGTKFCGYTVKGELLYIFNNQAKNLICLDMNSGVLRQHNWGIEKLPAEIRDLQFTMFMHGLYLDGIEYLPCAQTNMFVKIYLDDLHSEVIKIPELKEGIVDVACEEEILYFMTSLGNIVAYNRRSEEVKKFWKYKESDVGLIIPFYRLLIYKGFLWLIPGNANHICRVNIKTLKTDVVTEYPEGFFITDRQEMHPFKWFDGEIRNDRLCLYPYRGNMLLYFQDGIEGIKIQQPTNKAWYKHTLRQDKAGYVYREDDMSLFSFLNLVVKNNDDYEKLRREYFRGLQYHADGFCGERIWKYIKENLW